MIHSSDDRPDADERSRALRSSGTANSETHNAMLATCRQYLLLIANRELDPALAAKTGASDLVQETFLTARREFHQFRGATPGEFLRWLRQILLNHLLEARRRYLEAEKRSARRELSLETFCRLAGESLVADMSSPSHRLIRCERAEALEAAVGRLSERHREVIRLRHREQLPFEEVASRLKLSPVAARQLWARAVVRLRRELRSLDPAT